MLICFEGLMKSRPLCSLQKNSCTIERCQEMKEKLRKFSFARRESEFLVFVSRFGEHIECSFEKNSSAYHIICGIPSNFVIFDSTHRTNVCRSTKRMKSGDVT